MVRIFNTVVFITAFFMLLILPNLVAAATIPVVSIKTGACDSNDKCYVKSGNNEVIITTTNPVINNALYFQVKSMNILKKVSSCTGTVCTGNVRVTCTDRDQVELVITTPSNANIIAVDSQGNRMSGRAVFTCDNTPPALQGSLEVYPESRDPYMKSNDIIVINGSVTEDISEPSITADLSALGGDDKVEGTCTKKTAAWECVALAPVGVGPKQGKVKVYFSDTPNNTLPKESASLQVLALDETAAPDFWKVSSVQYEPKRFNTKIIDYFDKNVYLNLKLSSKKAGYEIVKVNMDKGCYLEGLESVTIDPLENIEIAPSEKNKNIVAMFRLDSTKFPESNDLTDYTFNCTLSLLNKKGDTLYALEEDETFTFTLQKQSYADAAAKVADAKVQLVKDLERKTNDLNNFKLALDISTSACNAITLMRASAAQIESASQATAAFHEIGVPQTLDLSGSALAGGADYVGQVPGVMPACIAITCQASYQNFLTQQLASLPGYRQAAQIMGKDDPQQLFDPGSSEILAYSSLCPRYILQVWERKQQIDCEYLRCLDQDAAAGFPVSQCNDMNNYMHCKFTMGGAMQLIPYVQIYRAGMAHFKDMIRNPYAMGSFIMTNLVCKHLSLGNSVHATCEALNQIKTMTSLISMIQAQIDQMKSISHPQNYCNGIIEGYNQQNNLPLNMFQNPATYTNTAKCVEGFCYRAYNGKVYGRDKEGNWYTLKDRSITAQELAARAGGAQANYFLEKHAAERAVEEGQGGTVPNQPKFKDLYFEKTSEIPPNREELENDMVRQRQVQSMEDLQALYPNDRTVNQRLVQRDRLVMDRNHLQRDVDASEQEVQQLEQQYENLASSSQEERAQYFQQHGMDEQHMRTLIDDKTAQLRTQQESLKNKDKEIAQHDDATLDYVRHENNWGTTFKTWSNAMGVANAVNSFSKLIYPRQSFGSYSRGIDKFFSSQVFNLDSYAEEKICLSNSLGLKSRERNIVITDYGAAGMRSGAHIEGMMDGPTPDEQGRNVYTYYVTGAVVPRVTDQFGNGFTFDIILKNSGEEKVINQTTLTKDAPSKEFTAQNALTVSLPGKYVQVCVRFHGGMDRYFDVVNLDNNRLCNTIES
ncbi:MAG: hypothetical protein V1743_07145 [Nanoarchaeota archaeon]